MNSIIYKASLENLVQIKGLISKSTLMLQSQYYKRSTIETAVELVSSIEELMTAGSFYVVEYEKEIIACGGWELDVSDSKKAEIRGFFVHPSFARQGIATRLLIVCENECLRSGIELLYLRATLAGEPFYKKRGFSELDRFNQVLSNGDAFELVNMEKQIQQDGLHGASWNAE